MEENRINRFMNNLRRLMKQRGIDAAQLSEKTGIPAPSINRILDEISSPNQAALERISEALDVSIEDLIGEDPPAKKTIEVTGIEKDIIEAYRKLPDNHWLKQAIDENLLDKSNKNE